jgi:hypothetical protein
LQPRLELFGIKARGQQSWHGHYWLPTFREI